LANIIMAITIFDTEATAEYYDDANVASFYERCWGGEDIHIGRYPTGTETIAEASSGMTRYLVERAGIGSDFRVIDIACGFGGTLRVLAGLGDRIEVEVGDFHSIDSTLDTWDAVICQEAIIHSTNRPKVFAEAHRVLQPGGVFALSDILTTEGADLDLVEAAFARLGASVGATISDYERMAQEAGFDILHVEERFHDIKAHYDKLGQRLLEPIANLDADEQALIAKSISRWQVAIAHGDITWACLIARKPG
jgi:cyclopropane fatty-acyl-phospholipid synthase-like methyltransferase